MELDIEKLLEVLKEKQREQEHTKENVNVKEELTKVIAQLEKPCCALLCTNENTSIIGGGLDILASLSTLVYKLLKLDIDEEHVLKAVEIAVEKYHEEN